MVFAHDTEVSLQEVTALVNTLSGPSREERVDHLRTPADLAAFVARWRWTGRHTGTERELAEVRALRGRLRRIWEVDLDDAVDLVNALLSEGAAMPQLVRHDDYGWHVHATRSDAPLAQRMAVEAAMAFVDLIRSDELDRLRTCAGEDCDDVVIDLSRNRSRRFCDSGCGNRANVAAYRARLQTGGADARRA